MRCSISALVGGIAAAAVTVLSSMASAAAISPGNLVVYRVGTGAAALTASATPVFLDEYTTTGSLVQSIALSTTGAPFTATGNNAGEGIITPTQDGMSLVYTGYAAPVVAGGPNPGTTGSAGGWLVGQVTLAGTPTQVPLVNRANTPIRSATIHGTSAYVNTNSNGLYYPTFGTAYLDAPILYSFSLRQVYLVDDTLYSAVSSPGTTSKVLNFGVLPTTAHPPTTTVATLATSDIMNGIYFADLNSSVAGVDTLYAFSTSTSPAGPGILRKYSYDGADWASVGSITMSTVNNVTGNVTGIVTGTSVTLYMTTSNSASTISSIVSLTDATGSAGTLAGTPTLVATAAPNTVFRGIGTLAIVPEPTGLAAVAAGLGATTLRRRRNR